MWALQPYISGRVCSQDLSPVVAEVHSSAKESTSFPRGPTKWRPIGENQGRENLKRGQRIVSRQLDGDLGGGARWAQQEDAIHGTESFGER